MFVRVWAHSVVACFLVLLFFGECCLGDVLDVAFSGLANEGVL